MKKSVPLIVSIILSGSFGFAETQKTLPGSTQKKNNIITILEKGVKRKVHTPLSKSSKKVNKEISSNSGVVVVYKNPSVVVINEFESKYDIKLKTKMAIGYYIFENHSSKSDIAIVSEIIANEKNIKTVKPNWKLRNTIR